MRGLQMPNNGNIKVTIFSFHISIAILGQVWKDAPHIMSVPLRCPFLEQIL